MRKLLLLAGIVTLFTELHSQTWAPLGTAGLNNSVLSIFSNPSGDTVYAGGRFSGSGTVGTRYVAMWANNQWQPLSSGLDNPVKVITQIDGKVYAGGEFAYFKDSLMNCFAQWDGTKFVGYARGFFKSGQHTVSATVNGIASYKNQIYAGGIFDYGNDKTDYMKNIGKWNGNKWEDVGGGVDGASGVNCMMVFHDVLYVGGGFTNAGSNVAKYIAKWDGTNWSAVGGGMNNEVTCFEVFNDTLYAGGVFTQADGKNITNVAKWDGSAWQAVGSGINGPVYALKGSADHLFAGGYFTTAGGNACKNLASWDGATWQTAGDPSAIVYALGHGGYMIAGGDFTSIGGNTASKIAKYFSPSGLDEKLNEAIKIYPNPANDQVKIESKTTFEEVVVYDLLGNEMISGSFTSTIDLRCLTSGNYVLFLKGHEASLRKLMVVSHE